MTRLRLVLLLGPAIVLAGCGPRVEGSRDVPITRPGASATTAGDRSPTKAPRAIATH